MRSSYYSKLSQAFSGRDGTVLVAPASPKEAVTHHIVGQQKNEDREDNYKQELSSPQPDGPSFVRRHCIQIRCHQSRLRTSLRARDNAI
jgi:hypothetical protein